MHFKGVRMEKDTAKELMPVDVRKAYSKPALVEYGSIAKLTQGGASVGGDGGSMQAACL